MSFATALQDAEKAVQGVLSFFTNVNTIYDILQSSPDKRPIHNNSYLDYTAIRDSTLSKGASNVDGLQSAIDRVNVATFTTAVWLDNVRYDEAISIFFPQLIPKQLHARDDIIDLFLTIATRWAIAETRWPTGIHTTDDVIKKIKQRIQKELKDKDALLSQRIWSAFKAKFGYLDSTPLWDLQNMVNANRMKETWFKALPMVLEAIDRRKDHCETSAGMKRPHNQKDPVGKRHRRVPIVVSAISEEEDVESQDEHTRDNSSNEDEYYDALDTWAEENGSDIDHGLNGSERLDPSPSAIAWMPPFCRNSAQNNNHNYHIPHLNSEDGHLKSPVPTSLPSGDNTQQQDDQANNSNNQSSRTRATRTTTAAAPKTQGTRKQVKHRRWTEEELATLEEGLRLYGRNWAKIQEYEIFRNRTRDQLGATARGIAKRRKKKQVPLGPYECLL